MTEKPILIKLEQQHYTTTSSECTIKVSATFNIEIEKFCNIYKGQLTEQVLNQLIKERK
jgi:hypothetical protein